MSASWVYVFGAFRLDPARRLLTYGSEFVPLAQRLFDLLLVLVRANGAIISRGSLYSLLWPEGGVSGANLSQHIYMLRRALGERGGDALYIGTVHDRGFRFVAPISVVDSTQNSVFVSERSAPPDQPVESNLNVIRAYGHGCRLLDFGTAAHLRAAADQFRSTLRDEPKHAVSLAGLARAHLLLAQNGYSSASDEFPRAKDAVIRALQLNRSCAAAHAILSNIILFCDWNLRDAKRELDLAVQLNGKSATVRASSAWLLAWVGRPDKGLTEILRAVTNDVSSPGLRLLLGRALIDCGDYERAAGFLSDLMEMEPELMMPAQRYRAEALILSGRPKDAILDLKLIAQCSRAEDLAWRIPLLALAYARNGDTEKAEDAYNALVSLKRTDYVPFSNLVPVALELGRRSQALDHFEKALRAREPMLPLLRHSPWLRSIRQSDIFKSLCGTIATCKE